MYLRKKCKEKKEWEKRIIAYMNERDDMHTME